MKEDKLPQEGTLRGMDFRTKEEQVADFLREGIISGTFPRGSRLKQAEIAERSRAAVAASHCAA